MIEDLTAQFAVACYVAPYCNSVMSVWVYVCTLVEIPR